MAKYGAFLSVWTLFRLCLTSLTLSGCDGFPANTLKNPKMSFKYKETHGNCKLAAFQAEADQSEVPFFDKLLQSIGMTSISARSSSSKTRQSPKFQKSVKRLPKKKVIIIGTGLSGLAAAKELTKAGCNDFLIIDSADGPGGRVRTDVVDGYLLDRGFQVFIDSYPEAKSLFDDDFNDLNLKSFLPGALVHYK